METTLRGHDIRSEISHLRYDADTRSIVVGSIDQGRVCGDYWIKD